MGELQRGTVLSLSPARRMVVELLHHAKRVPSLPLARVIDVSPLVEARRQSARAPSWMAIFMRAYGKVALEHPELRRAYIRHPWPRLYEHPRSEAALIIEREWEGETIVLVTKVIGPETTSLARIDEFIHHWKTAPVWEIASFRRFLRYGKVPQPLLRLGFWYSMNFSGGLRTKRMGTFSISSLGRYGVEQMHPLTPLTTYFTFGPVEPSGKVTAKIIYDHRVMDGGVVSRSLVTLERVLQSSILEELTESRRAAA